MTFSADNKQFQVTFSAGVVNLNEYDNVQTAISFADKALYRAKEDGRNKVIMYRKR
jgi:PleD family two-component response regulator